MKRSGFRRAQSRVKVTVGESVRIIRELQELSQNDLAAITGIPRSTLSAIERARVNLGVERAKVIARALECHPAVLVFQRPGMSRRWQTPDAASQSLSENRRG